MCETANIENVAVKVCILFTPTREYMRNSKHLTYGYKMHIWFFPTRGYMRNNKTFEILLYESVYLAYTGICAQQ